MPCCKPSPHRRRFSGATRLSLLSLLAAAAGCAGSSLPDPQDAARRYAEAAARGDAEAMHAMLTSEAQSAYGKDGVRELVQDAKNEIATQAKALSSDGAAVRAIATVRYADGEQAELVFEDGAFRVGAAGTLPAGARTPSQALAELRRALARRSYSGLMRVLTSESRSAVENDMRSLVDGLEQPETLDVKVDGDRASVVVPGGHSVKLRREAGVWRVEDFD